MGNAQPAQRWAALLDPIVHFQFSTALMLVLTLEIRKCSCTYGQTHRVPCGHAVFPSSIILQIFFAITDRHSVQKTQRMRQLWGCGDLVRVRYSYLSFFSFGLCLCHSINLCLDRGNLHLVNADSLAPNPACLSKPVTKFSPKRVEEMNVLMSFHSREYQYVPTQKRYKTHVCFSSWK